MHLVQHTMYLYTFRAVIRVLHDLSVLHVCRDSVYILH